MRKVAIVTLNYNGLTILKDKLFECIDSLFNLRYPRYDVIIVDNGSTDESFDAIRNRYGNDAFLIKLKHNYGFTGGNILGLEKYIRAKHIPDYVLLVNNDFKITNQEFLNEVIKFLERKRSIGIAQGINLLYHSNRIDSAGAFITNIRGLLRFSGFRLSEYPEKTSYISYAVGSCIVLKYRFITSYRDLIFTPYYFAYWEEAELSLDLWRKGIKSVVLPVLAGEHLGGITFKEKPILRDYLKLRNEIWTLKKHVEGILRLYMAPSILNITLPLIYRPLQRFKGKILTRALTDGFFIKPYKCLRKYPYYPLIIIIKSWKVIPHSTPGFLKYKVFKHFIQDVESKISVLIIDDDQLKSSQRPWLISINL